MIRHGPCGPSRKKGAIWGAGGEQMIRDTLRVPVPLPDHHKRRTAPWLNAVR